MTWYCRGFFSFMMMSFKREDKECAFRIYSYISSKQLNMFSVMESRLLLELYSTIFVSGNTLLETQVAITTHTTSVTLRPATLSTPQGKPGVNKRVRLWCHNGSLTPTSPVSCTYSLLYLVIKAHFLSMAEQGLGQWASCQIGKIAGCACAGNVFPATDFKGSR